MKQYFFLFIDRKGRSTVANKINSDSYNLIDFPQDGKGGFVFLGGVAALSDKNFMNHINSVVTIIDPQRFPLEWLKKFYKNKAYLYLPLDDDPNEDIKQYFEKSYKFIENNVAHHKNVYIHCVGMKLSFHLFFHFF